MSEPIGPWLNQALLADALWNMGLLEINSGLSHYSNLGTRFVNTVGADLKMVFSPVGWLAGIGGRTALTDVLVGLGDDVSFCLGSRLDVTYGGPFAEVVRGPVFRKLGQKLLIGGNVVDGLDPIAKANAALGDDAFQPPMEVKDVAEDVSTVRLIKILSFALVLVMAAQEYYVREAYSSYDGSTGHLDLTNEPSKMIKVFDGVHRLLPRRLMAVIYHLENVEAKRGMAAAQAHDAKCCLVSLLENSEIYVYCRDLWQSDRDRIEKRCKLVAILLLGVLALIVILLAALAAIASWIS